MNQFEEQDYSNSKIDAKIWKKIFKLVLKNKKHVAVLVTAVICLAFLDVMYPLLNSYSISTFFENQEYEKIPLFILAYSLVVIGYGVTVFTFIKMAGKVEVEVAYELRKEAFLKLQNLPFSYYDKTPAGWIMARLTSDSRKLSNILSWGLVDMLWGFATMSGIMIILILTNIRLALINLALTPVIFVIGLYFRKTILKAYRKVRKINSKITASYSEGISGSKTTKTLVLEDKTNTDFSNLCNEMKTNAIKAVIRSSVLFPILMVVSYVGVLFIMRLGGGMVLNGDLSLGVLYLFIICTIQFFDPVMHVSTMIAELQQAQASAERIMSLIETPLDIYDEADIENKYGTILHPKKENWERLNGEIEFENVSFKYEKGETILKDFNLKIKKGMNVALVGETGSGKSTIINLISRFYEPTTGIIKIDGIDYKARSISWLHANLGYVLQNPFLFNGTIMENIRYGKLDATEEEILEISKEVGVDDFVQTFDIKYNTIVGEGGSKLSVGQRQLICFARALISNPKILILDEATSSIDTKTELSIQKIIEKITKDRTCLMVAHRLSTVVNADLILVIKKGEIVEKGSHSDLLKMQGEYYELYRNQFITNKLELSKNI